MYNIEMYNYNGAMYNVQIYLQLYYSVVFGSTLYSVLYIPWMYHTLYAAAVWG